MLTAEDIAVARAAARDHPADGKFDRESRIEFHMIGEAIGVDTKHSADRGARKHAATPNSVIRLPVREDDIEGDTVDAGILATDSLGEIDQPLDLHLTHTPASTSPVLNNAIGSSIRIV